MTLSETFEMAAERIVLGRHRLCCPAIYSSSAPQYQSKLKAFTKLYHFSDREKLGVIGPIWWGYSNAPEEQLARSLALLFAAEFYRKPKRRK